MIHTPRKRPDRKAKKSFTLSPESVTFLETLRRSRHATSVSSVLEEILQMMRRERGKAAAERAVADYYSSLSDAEAKEEIEWGELALREFPGESA